MSELTEIIIKKQKYFQLPQEIPRLEKSPESVNKLSFQYCLNSKIVLDDNWANLEYIEIIGCKYLEFSINLSKPSQLKQILVSHSDLIEIQDIYGKFLSFSSMIFVDCKSVKFKGTFKGENHLSSIKFQSVLQLQLFIDYSELSFLKSLYFTQGCHFLKLDLSQLIAPNLETISFMDSNYVNILSLGNFEKQLKSFRFENCAYPKLSMDFSKFAHLESNKEPNDTVASEEPEIVPIFRKIKPRIMQRQKKEQNSIKKIEPDLELIKKSLSYEEELKQADEFLEDPTHSAELDIEIQESLDLPNNFLTHLQINKDTNSSENRNKTLTDDQFFRFCTECGHKNNTMAEFCASCGEKIRK